MMEITASRAELEGRIDAFLLRQLDAAGNAFPLCEFVPGVTWNRFDLGFKLLYLDALRGQPSDFAARIYTAHIAAFSLGDMAEPGGQGKVGIDRFKADFATILQDIADNGFDPDQSLVPLARDGSLLNAGHRAACAIALGKSVTGVVTGLEPKIFDYRFFARRGISDDDLDACAMRLVEAMPHVAVALLWPAAHGGDKDVEALLGPLVYRRNVVLSLNGGHNLLARVYQGEPWLGDPADNFPGVKRKLMDCFSGSDDLRVLIFDAPPDVDRVALKDDVRAVYGIAKASVHITDTHAEAVEVSRLLLNRNARHFLDHGKPAKFAQTRRNVGVLKSYLTQHGIAPNAVAVDTGMVMGLYGLRAPNDIDVVASRPLPPGPVEQHDTPHREVGSGDILQDPARHFSYSGLKFVSLAEVAALKRKRLAGRDREDLLLIEPILSQSDNRGPQKPLSLRLHFFVLRVRRASIRLLFRLGIGTPLRRIYRRATGR